MQEFKRRIDQESEWSPNGLKDSSNVDGMQDIARSSHKMIEAMMQSAAEGKVYCWKSSFYGSNLLATFVHIINKLNYSY